jgi:hypothetical protein
LTKKEWEDYLGLMGYACVHKTLDTSGVDRLLESLAACRALLEDARDTFIWCSGSSDFALDGQAGKYWQKTVLPLIDAIAAQLAGIGGE